MAASAGLLLLWIAAVTAYWYLVVVPSARKLGQSDTQTSSSEKTKADSRLPVTLVTGFLGSGQPSGIL